MIETTLIDCDLAITESAIVRPAARRRSRIALEHGAELVLDGNRVRAHLDGTTWWLETADRHVWLLVTPHRRIWVYRDNGTGSFRRQHEIEDAWMMTTWLKEDVVDCDQHGHAWSPDQISIADGRLSIAWAWCVVCGIERIVSPAHGRELIWPADARLIHIATGALLPTMHGPLFHRERS